MGGDSRSAIEQMVVEGLKTLTDSQFLGFVALMIQDQDGPTFDYIARRVDMIALRIQAEETTRRD